MTDYENFIKEVRSNIADYLLDFDIEHIEVKSIVKNNNHVRDALLILPAESNISPTIYLDGYYMQYNAGRSMDDILKDISGVFRENAARDFNFELGGLDASKLFFKIVNYENNAAALSGTVYERFNDLALTVRYLCEDSNGSIASFAVTDTLLAGWEVSKDKVLELTRDNTRKLFPPVTKSLLSMLDGMIDDIPEGEIGDVGMYVITNNKGVNGAAYMAYPDVVQDAVNKSGISGDAYIIPSSIHEVIIIDASLGKADELADMVKIVNSTTVRVEDRLSDNVYKYDSKEKKIEIVNEKPEKYRDFEIDR